MNAEASTVSLGAVDGWIDFDIPGGTSPVSIARLRAHEPSRAQTLLVRFPDGWRRPVPGFYEAAEELVVLDGVLEMSDAIYRAGDWGYVPAGDVRWGTRAHTNVLVFAFFDGPARWHAEDAGGASTARKRRLEPGATRPSPFGDAVLLRDGPGEQAWFFERLATGAAAPVDADVLAVASREYAWVPAGAPMPAVEGPAFVRTFGGKA